MRALTVSVVAVYCSGMGPVRASAARMRGASSLWSGSDRLSVLVKRFAGMTAKRYYRSIGS